MAAADRPGTTNPLEEISGWKEIADFLGVSARTARNWERDLALPVYRRGAAIIAVRSELESWRKQSRSRLSDPAAVGQKSAEQRQTAARPNWTFLASIGLALLGVVSLGLNLFKPLATKGTPTGIAFDAKNLIVHDDKGQELWRYGLPALVNGAAYIGRHLPLHEWVGDIDGDGQAELLFIYAPLDDLPTLGTPLFCFSPDGRVKWKYIAGRHLSLPNNPVSSVYSSVMQVLPKEKAVLVSSNHSASYPHQITLLGGQGNVLGEYWHPGHLYHRAFADLDGDGKDELLLAGVNNDKRQATLVVLDMEKLAHATISTGRPESVGLPLEEIIDKTQHVAKAVVFFPRSCITERLHPYNRANGVTVHKGGIDVGVSEKYAEDGPYLIYHLDFQLNPLGVTVSDAFDSAHKTLEAERKLNHHLTQDEVDKLKHGVVVVRR